MPIFGITASSNMSIKLTDFYQISTTTLTGNQLQIDLTSIPSDYTHLQLRMFLRNSEATTDSATTFRLNDDSSSNYSQHYFRGTGASVFAGAATSQTKGLAGWNPGSSSNASVFGGTIIDILDYKDTNKYKTIRGLSCYDNNGSGHCWVFSSAWLSTSAVTKISLTGDNQAGRNFVQYSRFDLYGIKG